MSQGLDLYHKKLLFRMERSVKLSKSAELPFLCGVIITITAGAILWSSLIYGISLLF